MGAESGEGTEGTRMGGGTGEGGGGGGTDPLQTFQRLTLCLWALHGKNRLQMVLVGSDGGLREAGCLCRCPQSRVPGVKGVILPLLVKKVILPFFTTIIFDWGPGWHLRRCPAPPPPRNPPPLLVGRPPPNRRGVAPPLGTRPRSRVIGGGHPPAIVIFQQLYS